MNPRVKKSPPLVLFLLVILLAALCPLAAQAADTPLAAMQVEYLDQNDQEQTYQFTADESGAVTCTPEWPYDATAGTQGNYPAVRYDSAANTWQFGGTDNRQYFNDSLTITVPDEYPASIAMDGGNTGISSFGTVTVKGAVQNFTATANTTDTVIDAVDIACTGSVEIENTGTGGVVKTLTVHKAESVKLLNNGSATVSELKVENCTGDVTVTNTNGPVIDTQSVYGFTIQSARNVAITGRDYSHSPLVGFYPRISCTGTITLKNNGNGGLVADADAYARLKTMGGTPAYYTAEDAAQYTLTAPTDTAINYLKIVPCTVYGITVTEGTDDPVTVTSLNAGNVLGDGTMTYAGGKLKFESSAGNTRTFNVAVTGADPVDVEFTSGAWNTLKDLTISGAHDVTVGSWNSLHTAACGDLFIDCTGTATIYGEIGSSATTDSLTVKNASNVYVGLSRYMSGWRTGKINGNATFEDCGEVHINYVKSCNVEGKVTVSGNKTTMFGISVACLGGGADITCNGEVTVNVDELDGNLKVTGAKKANIYAGNSGALKGNAEFDKCEDIMIRNYNGNGLVTGTLAITNLPAGNKYRVLARSQGGSIEALEQLPSQAELNNYNYLRIAPAHTVTVQGGGTANTAEACKDERVTLTAPASKNDLPFEKWEVVSPSGWRFDGTEGDASTTFTMPAGNVVLKARYTGDDDTDDTPADAPAAGTGGDAGAGAAAVLVGGAAVWGGYEVATRIILHKLLPEGAAIPKNRAELALLVWNTAGRPEPANTPAFADVADADTAKAAQWCVEQGYLPAKTETTFKPNGWTPKFKVIEVWNKAFPNV